MNATELKTKIIREVDVLDTTELEKFYGVMLNFLNSKKETQDWMGVTEQQKKWNFGGN